MAKRLWRLIERFFTSPKLLLLWLSGVAAGLVSVALGALIVIEGGLFNATASTPHLPAVALAAHTAFIRSVQVRARAIQPPARFTSAEVTAGFRDYDGSCAACHGGPGVPRADWAAGITPTPPFLEDAARRWRPGDLYWIVGQGVKMTAMPAWGEARSNGQLWDLVAFLEALPYLTTADYATMRRAFGNADRPDALPVAGRPMDSQRRDRDEVPDRSRLQRR
jgi:mono/diheme cytochrome c family protein